ncbi:MAG: NAD(P)H-dependent oxidoreductase [Bacteroidales bacterium]|jgi:chromate reductase
MNHLVKKDIVVLVGSLRKESYSRKMAEAMKAFAPETWNMHIVEIGDMPLYNEDLEGVNVQPPTSWVAFREQLAHANAVLIVTPEYNRSTSAALKNAIDIGSRPYTKNLWSNKPAAIVSISPGAIGGFGANNHLRQSLACLNTPVLTAPEMYIGNVHKLFDRSGQLLTDSGIDKLIERFFNLFERWVERF